MAEERKRRDFLFFSNQRVEVENTLRFPSFAALPANDDDGRKKSIESSLSFSSLSVVFPLKIWCPSRPQALR